MQFPPTQSEMYCLKKYLPHLRINKVQQNIADPSVALGINGIWEIQSKPVEFFPSYLHTNKIVELEEKSEKVVSTRSKSGTASERKRSLSNRRFSNPIKLNDMYLRVIR